MLVLSRQRDETIMIGDDIEVVIVDIRGDKVRLGVTAPKEIAVHRKEVYEAIKRENRAAAEVKLAPEVIGSADQGERVTIATAEVGIGERLNVPAHVTVHVAAPAGHQDDGELGKGVAGKFQP